MVYELRIGRWLFAATAVAFGAQCLILSQFIGGLQPVPASLVASLPWAWVNGAILIAGGLGLVWDRTARAGALALAALFLVTAAVLHTPLLVANLKNQADSTFHVLGIAAGALVLAAGASGAPRLPSWTAALGLIVFGLCTIGHGVMHFVFFRFTADFIPAWIPLHGFWAGATGAAQIAAGLAILSGVLARPAAALTGVMYGSWALLVHIPRIMADPGNPQEQTSLVIATALCASALVVAGTLAGPGRKGAIGRMFEA